MSSKPGATPNFGANQHDLGRNAPTMFLYGPQVDEVAPLAVIPRASERSIVQRSTSAQGDVAATLRDDPHRASCVLAEHYFEIGDTCASINMYESIVTIEPGHPIASARLDEIYRARQQWADVARILLQRVDRAAGASEQLQLLWSVAAIYETRLSDRASALVVMEAAFTRDNDNDHTARELARLATEQGTWSTVLAQHCDQARELEDAGNRDAAIRLWGPIAKWYTELGDLERASDATAHKTRLERAQLAVTAGPIADPFDVAVTLTAKKYVPNSLTPEPIVLKRKQAPKPASAEWLAVIAAKRGRVRDAAPPEQVRLLGEIASIYHGHLHDPRRAVATLRDALVFAPNDRPLLQRLQDLYAELEQWDDVVSTIKRFIDLESQTVRRGMYHHAAATVYRDALGSLDDALTQYRLALDAFLQTPACDGNVFSHVVSAFDAIDNILVGRGDWQTLKGTYQATLDRLGDPASDSPGLRAFRIRLLDGLAAVYRNRLQLLPSAIATLEKAAALDANADRAIQLGELHIEVGPHQAERAAAYYLASLREDPARTDSYRALRKLYLDTQQADKLWCVCRAMIFLRIAARDDNELYDRFKPRGMPRVRAAMKSDAWDLLGTGLAPGPVAEAIARIANPLASSIGCTYKQYGLRRRNRRNLAHDPLIVAGRIRYTTFALDTADPDLFIAANPHRALIELVNFIDKNKSRPALVIRPELFVGEVEREVTWSFARRLTYMRGAHLLRLVLTIPQLAARLGPWDVRAVTTWSRAIDMLSHRAAFTLCDDLDVAQRMIGRDFLLPGCPTSRDQLADIVAFSVSSEYFAVRKLVGLEVR